MATTKRFTADSLYNDPDGIAWGERRVAAYMALTRVTLERLMRDGAVTSWYARTPNKKDMAEALMRDDFETEFEFSKHNALKMFDAWRERLEVLAAKRTPTIIRLDWMPSARALLEGPDGRAIQDAVEKLEWQHVDPNYDATHNGPTAPGNWFPPPGFEGVMYYNPRRVAHATGYAAVATKTGAHDRDNEQLHVLGIEFWAGGRVTRHYFVDTPDELIGVALEYWGDVPLDQIPYTGDGTDTRPKHEQPLFERLVHGAPERVATPPPAEQPVNPRRRSRGRPNLLETMRAQLAGTDVVVCIENTDRPELNGSRRRVTSVQGAAYTCVPLEGPHAGQPYIGALPTRVRDIEQLDGNVFRFQLPKLPGTSVTLQIGPERLSFEAVAAAAPTPLARPMDRSGF